MLASGHHLLLLCIYVLYALRVQTQVRSILVHWLVGIRVNTLPDVRLFPRTCHAIRRAQYSAPAFKHAAGYIHVETASYCVRCAAVFIMMSAQRVHRPRGISVSINSAFA